MKNNKLLIGAFLSLIALILVEYLIYVNYSTISKDIVNISFVVSGDNLDYWENLQAGAQTAALDNDCMVTFTNSPIENGIDGEIEAVKRQLMEGADFVVVSSCDTETFEEYIEDNNLRGKVDVLEDVDYDLLEKDFGDYIVSKNQKNAVIISDYDCTSLMNNLKDNGIKAYQLQFEQADFENRGNNENIYCIDSRPEAVYYLDKGEITALAYRDDFSIGYITVKHILTGKTFGSIAKNVPLYYIVDKDLMYSEKIEKVLFPFVK